MRVPETLDHTSLSCSFGLSAVTEHIDGVAVPGRTELLGRVPTPQLDDRPYRPDADAVASATSSRWPAVTDSCSRSVPDVGQVGAARSNCHCTPEGAADD